MAEGAYQPLQHSHRVSWLGADLFLPEGVGFDVAAFVGELAHPLQGLAPQLLLEGLLGSLVGRNELGELGIGLRHGFNYLRHLHGNSNHTPWQLVWVGPTYWLSFKTAMKASWGTSTLPIAFMRFLPLACFLSSFFLREMSPP